jgi:hypothetical protein
MQWTGYSAGQQLLLGRVQKLGTIRAAHPALRKGTRATLSSGTDTWAYSMTSGSDVVYVAVNRGDSSQAVGGLPSSKLTDQMTGDVFTSSTINVPARSARILTP